MLIIYNTTTLGFVIDFVGLSTLREMQIESLVNGRPVRVCGHPVFTNPAHAKMYQNAYYAIEYLKTVRDHAITHRKAYHARMMQRLLDKRVAALNAFVKEVELHF